MLHEKLREDMIAALKARQTLELSTLRGALTTCTNVLMEKGKKPDEKLGDDEVITALKRLVKQRVEAYEKYMEIGETERAEVEQKEKEILEKYLPESMPEDEVRKIVENVKTSSGIEDRGKLIGEAMRELKGKADGSMVARIVNELIG